MSTPCRSCGAPMLWVITEAGRKMPLDPEPVEAGNVILRRGDNPEDLVAHVETKAESAARRGQTPPGLAYVPHHSTCPEADLWRKR